MVGVITGAGLGLKTSSLGVLGSQGELGSASLGQTGEDVYRREVELLQGIRACHAMLGTGDAFAAYLAAFRKEQRRKRNLMRLLDSVGLE